MIIGTIEYLIGQNFGEQDFRRTKFSAPSRNFGSFVQLIFFIGFLFTHTIHKQNMFKHEICINSTCSRFQLTKYFGRQNIRRTKLFGGQNFRQQVRFSAVLSAEILSDKV